MTLKDKALMMLEYDANPDRQVECKRIEYGADHWHAVAGKPTWNWGTHVYRFKRVPRVVFLLENPDGVLDHRQAYARPDLPQGRYVKFTETFS